jgi:vacuolar protein-sorting-associated protein 4
VPPPVAGTWLLINACLPRRFEKRVYIPLPDLAARRRILELSIGDTPTTLRPADFDYLADKCDGFSGSDISVFVRQALMEPLRVCRTAQFFSVTTDGRFAPCLETDPGASRMTLFDVPKSKLSVPAVSREHFVAALERTSPSVAPEELQRFEDWTSEFGEDGR